MRPKFNLLLFCVALFLLVPPLLDAVNGYAKTEGMCSVVMIVDGDTVKLECEDGDYKNARILGYDTPEKNAQCITEYIKANQATWVLRWALWSANKIEVRKTRPDKYGRDLIALSVDGNDIANRMITSGLARPYHGGKRQTWCAS